MITVSIAKRYREEFTICAIFNNLTLCVILQVDKELASGEYFLKEKERVAKKKELKKVGMNTERLGDGGIRH